MSGPITVAVRSRLDEYRLKEVGSFSASALKLESESDRKSGSAERLKWAQKKEEHRTATAPPTPAKGRKNSTQPMPPVFTGSTRPALLLANLDLAARFGGIWGKQKPTITRRLDLSCGWVSHVNSHSSPFVLLI